MLTVTTPMVLKLSSSQGSHSLFEGMRLHSMTCTTQKQTKQTNKGRLRFQVTIVAYDFNAANVSNIRCNHSGRNVVGSRGV